MKISSTLFVLASPLLVAANWRYTLGSKSYSGSGSHGCSSTVLHKGTQWKGESKSGGCTLRMYGDSGCKQKKSYYFETSKGSDQGKANTDHQAWDVHCGGR